MEERDDDTQYKPQRAVKQWGIKLWVVTGSKPVKWGASWKEQGEGKKVQETDDRLGARSVRRGAG